MGVQGFTDEVADRGREGEAPAEPTQTVGLGGSLALPGHAPAEHASKSDDPTRPFGPDPASGVPPAPGGRGKNTPGRDGSPTPQDEESPGRRQVVIAPAPP